MEINSSTKISQIIKENKEAIDVIASINKHFKKLKNPVLRKVLAPRVTVKDAARIGEVSVNEFLEKLAEIGFKVSYEESGDENAFTKETKAGIAPEKIVTLDVRPVIKAGGDPFSQIMGAIKTLQEDETLEIINVFEPTPLISILKEKGYKSWTEKIDEDEHHTFFTKASTASHEEIVASMPLKEGSFEEKLATFGQNIKEIDVRMLEMPEPMVTILSELEKLPDNHVLFVNHKKVPQFLLPELEKRNYQIMHREAGPGHVELIIFKG